MCRGIVKWSNLGLTNIKIIKLNLDIRDREDELRESYLPPDDNSESLFNPFAKIDDIELVGINNHKLVNFTNNFRKKEVKIFQDDPIYGLQLSSKQKSKLKERGEDVDVDVLKIKKTSSTI